jgi:hypothetical protein
MSKKSIVPFSNGTEVMNWMDTNCENCKRRDCSEKKAIEIGFITGRISETMASRIGMEGNRIKPKCDMKTSNPVNKPKKQPKEKTILNLET